MFRLVLVFALVAFVAGAPNVRPMVPMMEGRIIGGEDADIRDFPYQLSLQRDDRHMCGASLLSTTRVLTSAHCTSGSSPYRFTIRAGSTYRGQGGQVVKVSGIYEHPYYNPQTVDYDVAVLMLASPLILGSGVQLIGMQAIGQELADGSLAVVSGWGTLLPGGIAYSDVLQKVELPKVSDAACQDAYGADAITEQMTCYGLDQGGKDSCQGDSGGPLVAGGVQVGVASWGSTCAAAGYPGVYTKISNSHIQNYINSIL